MPFTQTYLEIPADFYTQLSPEPLVQAHLVALNRDLIQQQHVDLSEQTILDIAAGKVVEGMSPLAQKYTGHQFGYYNPDLGDGRGILLGQWQTPQGEHFDWHLKGAGRTPYSRRGDGRAVLRSVIREYLASEALHALSVPTTRALAIASGDEQVWRESLEPRANLIRVTPTHIRFGHFEWAASQSPQHSQTLADYVIKHHYPECASEPKPYESLLKLILQRTARTIAHWQAVGFNHGVMNTDNMSILGETFDFGPYAFFDDCQIDYICNHTDTGGRYAYNEQPNVGLWNGQVLAQAFEPLIESAEKRQDSLNDYVEAYNQNYVDLMRAKLGLTNPQPKDKLLIADLLICLDKHRVDYHVFMRSLADLNNPHPVWPQTDDYQAWLLAYKQRLEQETLTEAQRSELILNTNPALVLRNYIAQHIIEQAEKGDRDIVDQWRQWLASPFIENPEWQQWTQPPHSHLKGHQLSCSS
ncbi:protein adenylyltransferase SelO [Thiomicrospira pelophila]|uniref:protein adenylyltransferase SelO n=1 Tax=Thiomicrospira pelophila TaxID=934 RepID=UPI0004A72875|nr:YdiU family protein [Thiomicrospira pelophila]